MKEAISVALAQVQSERFDVAANGEKLRRTVESASKQGAGVVVFPEMFMTGYTIRERLDELAEPLDGPIVSQICEAARESGIVVVCGFPERGADGRIYNSAAVADSDGHLLGCSRKIHLFADEGEVFSAGNEIGVFDTRLGRVGVMICYDLEFPELARLLALADAECILVATANMEPYAEYQAAFVKARAMENCLPLFVANTVGDDGTFRYFGQSVAVSREGRILAVAGGEEALLCVDTALGVGPADDNLAYLAHRRPEVYRRLTDPIG